MIAALAQCAHRAGRSIASAQRAREMLGLARG
jgi:hypothetical protein